LSYDVSGPTHHCLEDISIMRTLPNIEVFSPSDYVMTEKFIDYSLRNKSPKYLRFDSKPVASLYDPANMKVKVEDCFCELVSGDNLCIVSTGFMSHTALKAVAMMEQRGRRVGVIDVFLMKPFKSEEFYRALSNYQSVITIEEGFIHKNGLDNLVQGILNDQDSAIRIEKMGFDDRFVFDLGGRECLHRINGVDAESVVGRIENMMGCTTNKGSCDDGK
ncbi:MAG: hypothetical protein KAV87_66030, partial [Desulfobacteraceae bacterium]|nr:hypothetical protein [Desulfobacteraceae bacterium]